jgi:dTDP-glucose 4,6-dehydratase
LLERPLRTELDPGRLRPPKSEVDRLVSDPTLAAHLLGWQARVGLREGLVPTIAWIADNAGRYRQGEYTV